MIEFKDVSIAYPGFCLDSLSFSLKEGESLGLFGPSGSGKSTVIDMILGFEKSYTGEIENNFSSFSVVFQDNRLIEEVSMLENIKAVSDKDPREILSFLGLNDFNKKAAKLSGGMKRRLALARALIFAGQCLILDEPFTGLDEKSRKRSIEAIKKFSKSTSTILISHNKEDFEDLSIGKIIYLK